MKYVADDGRIFKTSEACVEHEEKLKTKTLIKARVEKYLRMREYKNDGARRRALTVIMQWIDYDLIDNPERYANRPEEDAVVGQTSPTDKDWKVVAAPRPD